jgi:serine/threonine protein phosphatase PrpC
VRSTPEVSFLASWLPFGFVRASASARRAALESLHIEELVDPDKASTLIAGGAQVGGALPVRSTAFEGAVYSSRGRGYARYNEDAGGLFADRRGAMYALVLDQAGGLGGKVRGQASQIAAHHIFDACQRVARSAEAPTADAVLGELAVAYDRAHRILVQRGEGEVSTAVSAVLRPGEALLLNSGDSAALCFDARGHLKNETRPHELGPPNAGCLEHALGLVPEGPNAETYRWTLAPGDWVLLASDGLLDSGLSNDELGQLITGATDAEDATNRLTTTILRRMSTFRAKPDNLTLALVRALR